MTKHILKVLWIQKGRVCGVDVARRPVSSPRGGLPRLFLTLNNLCLLVLIYRGGTAKIKTRCISEPKLLG